MNRVLRISSLINGVVNVQNGSIKNLNEIHIMLGGIQVEHIVIVSVERPASEYHLGSSFHIRTLLVCSVEDVLCPSGRAGFSPNPRAPQ